MDSIPHIYDTSNHPTHTWLTQVCAGTLLLHSHHPSVTPTPSVLTQANTHLTLYLPHLLPYHVFSRCLPTFSSFDPHLTNITNLPLLTLSCPSPPATSHLHRLCGSPGPWIITEVRNNDRPCRKL